MDLGTILKQKIAKDDHVKNASSDLAYEYLVSGHWSRYQFQLWLNNRAEREVKSSWHDADQFFD